MKTDIPAGVSKINRRIQNEDKDENDLLHFDWQCSRFDDRKDSGASLG
jgi:hypothetical protein